MWSNSYNNLNFTHEWLHYKVYSNELNSKILAFISALINVVPIFWCTYVPLTRYIKRILLIIYSEINALTLFPVFTAKHQLQNMFLPSSDRVLGFKKAEYRSWGFWSFLKFHGIYLWCTLWLQELFSNQKYLRYITKHPEQSSGSFKIKKSGVKDPYLENKRTIIIMTLFYITHKVNLLHGPQQ